MRQSGFTLIEILVVLVIISIVTAVALVNLNVNQHRRVDNFSNELEQLITLAEEQAMLRPAILGLRIDNQHYAFYFYKADANPQKKEPRWILLENDKNLERHTIPDDIALEVNTGTENAEETKEPQIIFSTNGDITPFTIHVGLSGQTPRFVIRGEVDGSVSYKKLS